MVASADRRRISRESRKYGFDNTPGKQTRTTQPHLTTCRENRLQHLANFDVSECVADISTHTVLNDGHDLEERDFVAGRVACFKFASGHSIAELTQRCVKRWRVGSYESALEETMESG